MMELMKPCEVAPTDMKTEHDEANILAQDLSCQCDDIPVSRVSYHIDWSGVS